MARKPYLTKEERDRRANIRGSYAHKKDQYLQRRLKTNDRLRIRNRQYVWDYLKQHPCIECGEDNPVCLEFDHREPDDKCCNISNLVNKLASFKRLDEEIAKCDVLCSNCHKKRTAIQFNWHRGIVK